MQSDRSRKTEMPARPKNLMSVDRTLAIVRLTLLFTLAIEHMSAYMYAITDLTVGVSG